MVDKIPVFYVGHRVFKMVPYFFIMKTDFLAVMARFSELSIVVIGDVMLDHYISGTTERTSPEAPVPVVLVNEQNYFAGGAANVARNAAAAGAAVRCVAITGDDPAGHNLRAALDNAGVDTAGVVVLPDYSTIIKTRIVSQGQQIVRLDYEKPWIADTSGEEALFAATEQALAGADAVIFSDYGKGVLCEAIARRILQLCKERNVPVLVDPKGRDYSRYQGAFAITPNSREAQEVTGIAIDTSGGLRRAADSIRSIAQSKISIITRGADGLALLNESDDLLEIPTAAREVFDVTGAGDTFVAWLTLGIASDLESGDAARLANMAAGVSVSRSGPAVVSPFDMRQAMASGRLGRKLVREEDLKTLGDQLRDSGKKIVFTNGCFDFLHAGHVAFLQQARAMGDVLVLAMNTDESIRRLKGAPRPIIPQQQREELVAAIEAVDYVVTYREDTPHHIIEDLRPDMLVKGNNFKMTEVEGADLVRQQGGEVAVLPIVHNFSTSELVKGME